MGTFWESFFYLLNNDDEKYDKNSIKSTENVCEDWETNETYHWIRLLIFLTCSSTTN